MQTKTQLVDKELYLHKASCPNGAGMSMSLQLALTWEMTAV